MKKRLLLWIRAIRASFFSASVIPVIVGISTADHLGFESRWLSAAALLGVLLLHAASNLANDYFDDLNGSDRDNPVISPFSGGSRVIQDGLLTGRQMGVAALLCLGGGCTIGLVLAFMRGWPVLLIGFLGVMAGYLYSAPPVWLASKGLGEATTGFCFGPLIVLGTHYVIAQSLSWLPLIASLPVGFLITGVLYLNEFPDEAADTKSGKQNLMVRLGKRRSKNAFGYIVLLTYLSLAIGILCGILPLWVSLCLITAPLGWRTWLMLRHSESDRLDRVCAANIINHIITGLLLAISIWIG